MNDEYYIKHLQLHPPPEGGFYCRSGVSHKQIFKLKAVSGNPDA